MLNKTSLYVTIILMQRLPPPPNPYLCGIFKLTRKNLLNAAPWIRHCIGSLEYIISSLILPRPTGHLHRYTPNSIFSQIQLFGLSGRHLLNFNPFRLDLFFILIMILIQGHKPTPDTLYLKLLMSQSIVKAQRCSWNRT